MFYTKIYYAQKFIKIQLYLSKKEIQSSLDCFRHTNRTLIFGISTIKTDWTLVSKHSICTVMHTTSKA